MASLLGNYGSMVNCVSFLCLACGISNVRRRLGIRVALSPMPFVIGATVLAFDMAPTLSVLFWIMVGEAISYALNSPCLKHLYIPTSPRQVQNLGLDRDFGFASRSRRVWGHTLLKVFQAGAAKSRSRSVDARTFASASSGVLLVGWFFAGWFLAGEQATATSPHCARNTP